MWLDKGAERLGWHPGVKNRSARRKVERMIKKQKITSKFVGIGLTGQTRETGSLSPSPLLWLSRCLFLFGE